MAQLPYIKQYVLGKRWKTIITRTNNLMDTIFDNSFYLGPTRLDRLTTKAISCF